MILKLAVKKFCPFCFKVDTFQVIWAFLNETKKNFDFKNFLSYFIIYTDDNGKNIFEEILMTVKF